MSVVLDAGQVLALGPVAAVRAVRHALASGLDPDAGMPRTIVPLAAGQGLLMPSESGGWFGVKVATVAPGNAARGLARINATYLLHDSATLTPVAVLDGVALTALRTPAVSVAACLDRLRALARRAQGDGDGGHGDGCGHESGDGPGGGGGLRVVVFGAGPQARWHVRTLRAHVPLAGVTVVTRCGGAGRPAPDWAGRVLAADDPAVAVRVRAAHVVVAATSARHPLFDGRLVSDTAVVLAVGSHEPEARELDGTLMARAAVVVESRATALREAGDVVQAVAEGRLDPGDLVSMADLLTTRAALPADRPVVVKTTGMAWEDLVVAVAALDHHRKQPPQARPSETSPDPGPAPPPPATPRPPDRRPGAADRPGSG